jgi:hypothetical protein
MWEKLGEVLLTAVNAPLQPLLDWIKSLLTAEVNPTLLLPIWSIIIYIISLFYGLFFLFAGFNFMISGYDSVKREHAKSWMRNIILMVIFVQSSYFLYSVILEVASSLTSGIIQLINPQFFLLTADSITSLSFQLVLMIPYVIVLTLTLIFLALRYLLVYVGVIFFAIAMFFYFIPPLAGYGKMIVNVLLIIAFTNFISALILLTSSLLISLPIFGNMKIVVMITSFVAINSLFVFLILFGALKAIFGALNSELGSNLKSAAKFLI